MQTTLQSLPSHSEQLCSDGVVQENGIIKMKVTTRAGATLSSDNVLAELKKRHEEKEADRKRKELEKQKREV